MVYGIHKESLYHQTWNLVDYFTPTQKKTPEHHWRSQHSVSPSFPSCEPTTHIGSCFKSKRSKVKIIWHSKPKMENYNITIEYYRLSNSTISNFFWGGSLKHKKNIGYSQPSFPTFQLHPRAPNPELQFHQGAPYGPP